MCKHGKIIAPGNSMDIKYIFLIFPSDELKCDLTGGMLEGNKA